jgi:hypothetical protein
MMTRPRRRSGTAAPTPGPRAARTRERFREFAPPELVGVEPPDEDEDDAPEAVREPPEHLRLVRTAERISEPGC